MPLAITRSVLRRGSKQDAGQLAVVSSEPDCTSFARDHQRSRSCSNLHHLSFVASQTIPARFRQTNDRIGVTNGFFAQPANRLSEGEAPNLKSMKSCSNEAGDPPNASLHHLRKSSGE